MVWVLYDSCCCVLPLSISVSIDLSSHPMFRFISFATVDPDIILSRDSQQKLKRSLICSPGLYYFQTPFAFCCSNICIHTASTVGPYLGHIFYIGFQSELCICNRPRPNNMCVNCQYTHRTFMGAEPLTKRVVENSLVSLSSSDYCRCIVLFIEDWYRNYIWQSYDIECV